MIYAVVLTSALLPVGPDTLAGATAPLAEAVAASDWSMLTPVQAEFRPDAGSC